MNNKLKAVGEALRTAVDSRIKNRKTAAIIVAAGSSARMGGDTPKQFLPLCGMPVVVRTLRAYESAEYIDSIVAVVRPGDREKYLEYKEKFGISKLSQIVEGGATRQESVLRGVEAVGESAAYIAIADGARPLSTPEIINRVCLAAYRHGGAVAAYPAFDTIKVADKKGFVTETVERSTVWHATTPQIFALNVYRAAAYTAKDSGFEATDDSALVENIGYPVKLVDAGRENIKITTSSDLSIAEALIRRREEEARIHAEEKAKEVEAKILERAEKSSRSAKKHNKQKIENNGEDAK